VRSSINNFFARYEPEPDLEFLFDRCLEVATTAYFGCLGCLRFLDRLEVVVVDMGLYSWSFSSSFSSTSLLGLAHVDVCFVGLDLFGVVVDDGFDLGVEGFLEARFLAWDVDLPIGFARVLARAYDLDLALFFCFIYLRFLFFDFVCLPDSSRFCSQYFSFSRSS